MSQQPSLLTPCSSRWRSIAYVALGSNLGDRLGILQSALTHLRGNLEIHVEAVSTVIETAPVGPVGQGPYLNAVAKLATSLAPQPLLQTCLQIEKAHGRDRTTQRHWDSRTLDIDMLLYDDQILDEPGLHVPHPHMAEREFVLIPLAEIAPDVMHPVLKTKVSCLLRRLTEQSQSEYDRKSSCSYG